MVTRPRTGSRSSLMASTQQSSESGSGSRMMITLDYNPADHSAVLTADPTCPPMAWAEVRRLCEERGQGVENTAGGTVVLPWWSLLVFRQDLGFAFRHVERRYGIRYVVTDRAAALLRQANTRQDAYRQA